MYDLHCHILPGVDDGADSLGEALEMARSAAVSGVTHLAVTPHCNLPESDEKNYLGRRLNEVYRTFAQALREEAIPLRLQPGAEIFGTRETPELLRRGLLPKLGRTNYMLMEFWFDESAERMESIMEGMLRQGVRIIVAHPERYEAVQKDEDLAERWFRAGLVLQLNKGSILGSLGRRAQTCADRLLSYGLAHLAASDAHGPEVRTPDLGRLARFLEREYGPECPRILLEENPARIWKNGSVLRAGE